MTRTAPPPLTLAPYPAPDRDFDALRTEAIQVIVADAGATWTDHNLSDPGITLLEVFAWGLADLHYRTATRTFDLAPLELPLWLDRAERDWYGLPPLEDPAQVIGLAATMAAPAPPAGSGRVDADRMAAAIAASDSRRAAIGALIDRAFGAPPRTLAWAEAAAVVSILRSRVVRRAILDQSATVAAAFEEARRTIARRTSSGPIDEAAVDRETVRLLGYEPGLAALWDDEVRSLIRRHRHRLFVDRVAALQPALGGDAPATVLGLQAALDVGPGPARAALALHPCPPDEPPEGWETADGSTTTWPPHPLQARTTEPVTAEDYATRARTGPNVRRAWAVPHVLAGIGWDGGDRVAAADRPGAISLLVEPAEPPAETASARRAFLRGVLSAVTAGPGEPSEIDAPYDTLATPNLQVPRRMLADELGVALVRQCPVTLGGVFHVPLGVARTQVIDDALARVAAFFAAGRPESASVAAELLDCPAAIEGPWPRVPQPPGGWRPGEAIRLSELVQVLSNDPNVIGIEGVEVEVGSIWYPGAAGGTEIPLAPDCVPILDERQCLQVRLELAADCIRG